MRCIHRVRLYKPPFWGCCHSLNYWELQAIKEPRMHGFLSLSNLGAQTYVHPHIFRYRLNATKVPTYIQRAKKRAIVYQSIYWCWKIIDASNLSCYFDAFGRKQKCKHALQITITHKVNPSQTWCFVLLKGKT